MLLNGTFSAHRLEYMYVGATEVLLEKNAVFQAGVEGKHSL